MVSNIESSCCVPKYYQHELPNLLLSTTYALNKSNSKRAIVGFEYDEGLYIPVLKLGGSGAPSTYVTLTRDSWKIVIDQMDTMNEYLTNSFAFCKDFGNSMSIYLQNLDIHFTQTYGERTITFDEKSVVVSNKLNDNKKGNKTPQASTSSDNAASDPPTKKQKFKNPPSLAMQLSTFEGLRKMRMCITNLLNRFEYYTGFINRSVSNILYLLKEKLPKEVESQKQILKDSKAFKQFYSTLLVDVERTVYLSMDIDGPPQGVPERFMAELYSYCLPLLAKDLYAKLYEK